MKDHVLDVLGVKCPLPVLRARKRMADLSSGETMQILATDPAVREDFMAYCEATGHQFLGHRVTHQGTEDIHEIHLRKT